MRITPDLIHFTHIEVPSGYRMVEHPCERCGKVFKAKNDWARHMNRRTPCAPIVDAVPEPGTHLCQYCGRQFASRVNVNKHIKSSCKIAGTAAGMELLFEHTLKKQEAAALEAARAEIEKLRAENERLKRGGPAAQTYTLRTEHTSAGQQVNANTGINNGTINTVVLSFSEAPTRLTTEKMLAALRTCPGFSQYALMGDTERFDKDNRAVVHDSIMDLTRLNHEDPLARNVYLSPNRADQVMILAGSDVGTKKWEVLQLDDALKQIIGSMSRQLRDVGHDHSIKIDIDDRGALCGLGFITQVEEIRLAHELRKPMSAHLENQRQLVTGGR
jgi:predicted  nucleic acid-binding Zn-ribbon protein